ncbi:hypothetical protein AMATHDRAFT_67645 [Amanita thiersii Skay4041]|uniref:Uncharacterized protein n=1 Tax=Amanita thiersii Skay4041 TaxID=703135 RepID=A0A2A9NBR2_9AGAR|nr:hypothetical protein AMATHDRAFT_67645 [Amanita thiersii Skay4041]
MTLESPVSPTTKVKLDLTPGLPPNQFLPRLSSVDAEVQTITDDLTEAEMKVEVTHTSKEDEERMRMDAMLSEIEETDHSQDKWPEEPPDLVFRGKGERPSLGLPRDPKKYDEKGRLLPRV